MGEQLRPSTVFKDIVTGDPSLGLIASTVLNDGAMVTRTILWDIQGRTAFAIAEPFSARRLGDASLNSRIDVLVKGRPIYASEDPTTRATNRLEKSANVLAEEVASSYEQVQGVRQYQSIIETAASLHPYDEPTVIYQAMLYDLTIASMAAARNLSPRDV